jgi:hypothetical protein
VTASEPSLFGDDDFQEWRNVWLEMPAFDQHKIAPYHELIVRFGDAHALRVFSELVEQTITPLTLSIRFPKPLRVKPSDLVWSQQDDPT